MVGRMKIQRNDPCPCGSGKKYKQCCLGKDEQKKDEHQHEQVRLEVNGMAASVDRGMAPFLRILWERGINTVASCQADKYSHGMATVLFASMQDAEQFLAMLWETREPEEWKAGSGYVWDSSVPDLMGWNLPKGWHVFAMVIGTG